MDTAQAILKILDISICDTPETFDAFKKRLNEGAITRDENPQPHFVVYFLPYNSKNKKVFITHHKKSGLWLSPGGHIDKGEVLQEALNREINEELGLVDFFREEPKPFLLASKQIENKGHPCKMHYDIWYLVKTDGNNFKVDPSEFLGMKWLSIEEAKKIVTDESNIKALEIIEKL